MKRYKKNSIIVGLDIGTTKICALVGHLGPDGLSIIGSGRHPSYGLKKGVVIDIEATVRSIHKAIEKAKVSADCHISSVYAGIAGSHIQGINSHGIAAIKHREVRHSEIERVIESAKALTASADREVLHVLPQEFIIDGLDGIREPLGMSGSKLEAKIHVVTGAVASAQNIIKSAERCNLRVNDIVLEQLASSIAVLSEDEKELGVALVDIGGGTTDIAIFFGGSIKYTAVIPIGGNHLTNDIAIGLRTPHDSAQEIKEKFGCATPELIGKDEVIEVPSIGVREKRVLKRQILGDILSPRVDEILELILYKIKEAGVSDLLASGIVFTGGSTLLTGFIEKAEDAFGIPTRLGLPENMNGLSEKLRNPSYSTAVGLIKYGAQHIQQRKFQKEEGNIYTKIKKRMSAWISDMI